MGSIGTTTYSSWLLSSSSSSSSLSSSLSLGLSSSYNSNNNNNNIDESVISSTQDVDGVAIATHNNFDTNIGQCQTTGTYSSVIEYTNGHSIGYKQTYIGLSFNSHSYSHQTFVPDHCNWDNSKYHGNQCPESEGVVAAGHGGHPYKIVQAWQQCAKACNMDKRCLTYTAKIEFHGTRVFHDNAHFSYMCYLHDHYTCGKNGSGIAASELEFGRDRSKDYSTQRFWSGLCRRQDKCS